MLPNLMYLGDVPVESSYHGSALLYRLLEEYPKDRLMIVERKNSASRPDRRLPGVPYKQIQVGVDRILNTRFAKFVNPWRARFPYEPRLVRKILGSFIPQTVLTVAHGYSCLAASRFAQDERLPLHLILHDHWPDTVSLPQFMNSWRDKEFADLYRVAQSRLCVSPFMQEEYFLEYGVPGHVLYPAHAKAADRFPDDPKTYTKSSGSLIGAYAGSIASAEYATLISSLVEALDSLGGRLLLFGPHSRESLAAIGIRGQNIEVRGLVQSDELIRSLREEADFVFVPMGFEQGLPSRNMRLSFPSKLTDYTATGLPLLIWGPESCSIVRWAKQNNAPAEIVTAREIHAVLPALSHLESVDVRVRLGQAAADVGNRFFSHEASQTVFRDALLNNRRLPQSTAVPTALSC